MKSVDALYISHIHPDHFDEKFLAKMRKDIPVVILKEPMGLLRRGLSRLGFSNVLEVESHKYISVGPFNLYLYAPFVEDPFSKCKIGNLIDSAIVIESEVNGQVVFNANDNNPDDISARKIKALHPCIDVAQLPYNSAGPYPHAFNLTALDKIKASDKILERNYEHFLMISKILEPKYTMPFAGAYTIGGRNQSVFVRPVNRFPKELLVLREKESIDLTRGEITFLPKTPIGSYFFDINKERYDYELDPYPDLRELPQLLSYARLKLFKAQMRLGYFEDLNIHIENLGEWRFTFSMLTKEFFYEHYTDVKRTPYLSCQMDVRLLKRILLKKEHWNNAEIGCHIFFDRKPDVYSFDAHQMLSFFHT